MDLAGKKSMNISDYMESTKRVVLSESLEENLAVFSNYERQVLSGAGSVSRVSIESVQKIADESIDLSPRKSKSPPYKEVKEEISWA